jgi:hypothetical protein
MMTCCDRCGVSSPGRECGGTLNPQTQIATGWNPFSATKRVAQLLRNTEAMGRLLRHCRILHHHAANGYIGEGGDRTHAISRILDMIEGLEINPRQIVSAIEGQNVATIPTPPLTRLTSLPTIFPALRLGHIAAEDGSDLISMWAKETESRPEASIRHVSIWRNS